jgi:hypothetical protein
MIGLITLNHEINRILIYLMLSQYFKCSFRSHKDDHNQKQVVAHDKTCINFI